MTTSIFSYALFDLNSINICRSEKVLRKMIIQISKTLVLCPVISTISTEVFSIIKPERHVALELTSCTDFLIALRGPVVRVPGYRSRGSGFASRRYQISWEAVGLERGPLSLVTTIEELLGRNSSGSALEIREYGHGDPFRWPRHTLYPQKLALTSPKSGDRSVGIVRLRTETTVFSFVCLNVDDDVLV
jgi:hypothetical protein